ncbi:MAG: efflux RND transporter permease subunit [Pseudomonadales bacterium]|nr:efflux RND transporter permease subunit [Pseudomonadales bacterium]
MNLFALLVRNQRFVFAFAAMAVLMGLAAYGTMARQEDPSFPYRVGTLQVVYPGATAQQIEKLITEPLEEALAQVEELHKVSSISRDNVAIVTLQLADNIYATDTAWDRVRRAVDRAEREFPQGVTDIELEDRRMEIPSVVLSVTGSDDPIVLADAAEELKQRLLSLPYVSRIEINGAPENELIIEIENTTLNRLGINRQQLVSLLQQRNQLIPGGLINLGEQFIRINTASDLQSVEEIGQLPLTLNNGQKIPLHTVANISFQPSYPLEAQTFHNGKRAVSLGIINVRGQTDTIAFGKILRSKVAELQNEFRPLKIQETFFQPDYVASRLTSLQFSLLLSAGVIALVVLLALGWRTGILVALVLPVVALITLAVYNLGGGILHQIAVIGIVISLGILVDNAIVIVESIETYLRQGKARSEAVNLAIKQLAKPLFSSTGTTIAAFIPLLLSKGATADFTRGIPVMIMLALIVSYIISIVVLPLVAFYWLKPGKQKQVPGSQWIADKVISLNTHFPWFPLIAVIALLGFSFSLAPYVKMEFFPGADRNQMMVDMELPAGTPVSHTLAISERLERQLQARHDVTSVMRSVGMTGFRFYYNLGAAPSAPNRARLMVNTTEPKANQNIIDWIEDTVQYQMPEAVLIAKGLGQGPPVPAPIEIRLHHPNPDVLFQATQTTMAALHRVEGTRKIRTNQDLGVPEIALSIYDHAAEELGFTRSQLASEVFSQTRGLASGEFRYSNNPVTMRVRSVSGDKTALTSIPTMYLYQTQDGLNQQGQPVPLESMASLTSHWAPAEIHHFNAALTVKVLSELQPGAAFNQVMNNFRQELQHTPLPKGVTMSVGGESEGSGDANKAIVKTAPLGMMALLFFMMLQFNSFRRVAIILTTIPLAAIGILPGLVLSGQPFGFQPLLGVIALIGIVVNNAIVLVDVVDSELKAGANLNDAVNTAIQQRTAPILLTTATTILGLLPLALSESTLWPPMAWAIISGLAMSTVLTLVVIPSLCRLLLKKQLSFANVNRITSPKVSTMAGILIASALTYGLATPNIAVAATPLTLPAALERVGNNYLIKAQQQKSIAADQSWQASKRQAFFPKLTLGAEQAWRDDESSVAFPVGEIVTTENSAFVANAKIEQPLFSASNQIDHVKSQEQRYQSSLHEQTLVTQRIQYAVIQHYIAVQKMANSLLEQQALYHALQEREIISEQQFKQGKRLKSDLLQLAANSHSVEKAIVSLQQNHGVQIERLNQLLLTTVNASEIVNIGSQQLEQMINISGIQNLLTKEHLQSVLDNPCRIHPQCHQLQATLNATRFQKQAVSNTRLPEFNLVLQHQVSEGYTFVSESDSMVAINMQWQPFAGGAIHKQKQALAANQAALQQQLLDLKSNINVDIQDTLAQWQISNASKRLVISSLAASEERLRIVRKRFDQGFHTLDDLLDAEADFSRDRTQVANADLDRLLAAARWLKISGLGFESWLK